MTQNQKCPSCKTVGAMAPGTTELRSVVGPREFVATVPASLCAECGEAVISGSVFRAFEDARAQALASEGASDGAALRWLRKSAGLSGAELARLLGVAPETVSRRENGVQSPDRATAAVIADLALDALAGSTRTRTQLEALAREPIAADAPKRLEIPSPHAA